MADLSILIPARNEMFLKQTIENVLENIQGDTEIIAICDGNWPDPAVVDHPRVTLVHHTTPIGQRAGTNEAARISQARFVMKADAHCAFSPGFDVELMAHCEKDWTVIPRMYNLHAFDWVCSCGRRIYQGPTPEKCPECGGAMQREIVWKPRMNRLTDFARFDRNLHFQYWGSTKTCDSCRSPVMKGVSECPECGGRKFTKLGSYDKRPEAQGDIADVMCHVGACWMMRRDRYWELGGLDEGHGSWGQMGVEISCKSWLSGGRQVVNKKTWFAHMFRTQGKDFGFPYELSGRDVEKARDHSKALWMNNTWPGAIRPLSWLIEKFAPVPEWTVEDK